MVCQKCGKEFKDGSTFCPFCGEKVKDASEKSIKQEETNVTENNENGVEEIDQPNVDSAVNESNGQQIAKKSKAGISKLIKFAIAGVAAVAVVIIAICIIAANAKTTVKLNNYIDVSFDGYDGYGTASVTIDRDKFIKDYKKKLPSLKKVVKRAAKLAKSSGEDLGGFEDLDSYIGLGTAMLSKDEMLEYTAEMLYEGILQGCGSLDNRTGLKNGDKVTYKWSINDDLDELTLKQISKVFGIKLKYSDIDYVVSGLEKVPEFDPFEGVEVSFSGKAPQGYAEITNTPNNGLYYDLDVYDGLKNGDEVTVSISYSWYGDIDSYINEYGKAPTSTEKKFTVSGLSEYITSASQIDENTLNIMKNQIEDTIAADCASWDEGYTLEKQYIGTILLTAKNSNVYTNNELLLVYKMKYSNVLGEDNTPFEQEYYYYTAWDNLVVSDGEVIFDLSSYTKPDRFSVDTGIVEYDGWWKSNYNLTFRGVEKWDQFYNSRVTAYKENYNVEDNVTE